IKKKAVVKTYEGFKFLLAVKKLYDDKQNRTAFSYRFGAAWCGMSDKTLQTAMTQLQAFGYMQMVGKEGKGIRAVNVYQLRSEKR
ncbi:MAG: helix-turn-helix domain-containing protein, partial [Lactobacillus sp.]|nr:helix-turn-helix domain-containing protein [Lactobacillus sp.]